MADFGVAHQFAGIYAENDRLRAENDALCAAIGALLAEARFRFHRPLSDGTCTTCNTPMPCATVAARLLMDDLAALEADRCDHPS